MDIRATTSGLLRVDAKSHQPIGCLAITFSHRLGCFAAKHLIESDVILIPLSGHGLKSFLYTAVVRWL
jgi:hypothetical protein